MNPRLPLRLARLPLLRVVAFGLTLLIAGCGGASTGDVHGTVTTKKGPVTGGDITIYESGGTKIVQKAGIDEKGNYSVKGLAPGTYTVTVDTSRLIAAQQELQKKLEMAKEKGVKHIDLISKGVQGVGVPINRKYANPKSSGLSIEVKAGADQEQPITLTD